MYVNLNEICNRFVSNGRTYFASNFFPTFFYESFFVILPSTKYRFVATNVIMSSYTRDDRRSSSSTVSEVKSDELAKMIEGVSEGDPL